jgi:hypothetical protein
MRVRLQFITLVAIGFALSACNNQSAGTSSSSSGGTSSALSSATTTAATSTYTGINAFQIITQAGSSGSFDNAAVPVSGGLLVSATRLFNLDGSSIASGNLPAWFVQSQVMLTSTRTSAGTPTYNGDDTACAYFDLYSSDNNPDSSGFYTIDGYNTSTAATDIDQCAGTSASELAQLGAYFTVDRRFMNPTDKLEVIVKAKPIDAPNTAPTASTCVVGGYFDPSACVNTYYTVTMRSAPFASAQPFYILFPSAKAYDLLSETVLLPIQIDPSITTISVDRIKGGAILYGITVLRLL